MSFDCEDLVNTPPTSMPWMGGLGKAVRWRVALLVGIVIFAIAVGIDSFQHQASAAGMSADGVAEMSLTTAKIERQSFATPTSSRHTYLEYDPNTAERLSHSDLTSAMMTRSRLTSAHFFTGSGAQ
ncbi:MAG: hypothetical protein IGR76_01615 [Synechococcales cyanobacterium T60_A2020_003]|nr:hypothetical protein [Synechococcales cyanobacterium T60_A2020_003]